MSHTLRMYILSFDEKFASLAYGNDPFDAARNHYDELDRLCSPGGQDSHQEFSVRAFAVPPPLEHALREALEDLDGEELAAELPELEAKHPELTETRVNVVTGRHGASCKPP